MGVGVERAQPVVPRTSGVHVAVSPQAQFLVDWSLSSTWTREGGMFVFASVGVTNVSGLVYFSHVNGGHHFGLASCTTIFVSLALESHDARVLGSRHSVRRSGAEYRPKPSTTTRRFRVCIRIDNYT